MPGVLVTGTQHPLAQGRIHAGDGALATDGHDLSTELTTSILAPGEFTSGNSLADQLKLVAHHMLAKEFT